MKKIVIHLGNQCNAACKYCHCQKSGDKETLSPLLLSFLAEKTLQEQHCVRFIGGEPTLYLPQIKQIVTACHNRTEFTISTNGLLLSDDILVEFLNNHSFFVAISYDGSYGKRGHQNIFQSPKHIENIKKLKKIGCSTTLDSNNLNLAQLLQEFGEIENKIQRPFYFRPHLIHSLSSNNGYLSLADIETYTSQYKVLVRKFINEYINYGLVNTKLFTMFYYLYTTTKNSYTFPETRCYSNKSVHVTLGGKHYLCSYSQSTENYLGEIAESPNKISSRLAEIIKIRRPSCVQCDLYKYCGTYCLASKHSEIECKTQHSIVIWFLNEINKYGSARFSGLNPYGGFV